MELELLGGAMRSVRWELAFSGSSCCDALKWKFWRDFMRSWELIRGK